MGLVPSTDASSANRSTPDRGRPGQLEDDGALVVICDDDPASRKLLARVLQGDGHRTIEAADAHDTLDLVSKQNVDLVITDLVMPDMHGMQLAVRLEAGFPHLAVLFVSGYTEGMVDEDTIKKPKRDFLQKPYRIDDLSVRVRNLLGHGGARSRPTGE